MPLAEAPVVGASCKLYYNTGTHALPTWVEIKSAINVSANLGKGEADVSSRASTWKMSRGALRELEISLGYRHKQGADTVFDALQAAYVAGTPIEFAVMDGDITVSGVQGPRAFCEVMAMNLSQELENASEYEMTLKPTYVEEAGSLVEPDWYEVP